MYATHASFHSGLQTTPGALAFHSNMVMNIPLMSDLMLVQQNQQRLIDQHLIESNHKRFVYDYPPNQEVLKLEYKPDKLAPHVTGLYQITSVYTNRTITIQLTPHTRQQISIQNVKSFYGDNPLILSIWFPHAQCATLISSSLQLLCFNNSVVVFPTPNNLRGRMCCLSQSQA
jgi:hypothetical protein